MAVLLRDRLEFKGEVYRGKIEFEIRKIFGALSETIKLGQKN